MKNMKRILVTLVAAVLLMAVTVAGTLAWLQDQTETVTNTFEIGNVSISLKEGTVYQPDEKGVTTKPNGELVDDADLGQHISENGATRNEEGVGNAYKLMPGKTYDKDPKIYVSDTSEDCWLFVKVVNGIADIEANTIVGQMNNNSWTLVAGTTDVYSYATVVSAGAEIPVFETFTLTDNADIENYVTADNAEAIISIQAYAIQAEEIETIEEAWTAAGAQWPDLID